MRAFRSWGLLPLALAGGGCTRAGEGARPDSGTERALATPATVATVSAASAVSAAPAKPASSAPVFVVPKEQGYAPGDLKSGERAPLLVFLHGLGASGKAGFEVLGLRALGSRERIFVVAPDGTLDSKGRRFWNAHRACCDFDQRGVDDVGRLGALIDEFATQHAVDQERIYLVGYSNGGFMAQRLACRLSDRIAAFASIAGASPEANEPCDIRGKLAALEVHGDADDVVAYDGGTLFNRAGAPRHASARETLAFWGKRLGCEGKAKPGPSYDFDPRLAGDETKTETFDRCRLGSAALWTVQGGTHLVGRPKLVEQVWRFLSSHRKR